jgi:hypothetical protein
MVMMMVVVVVVAVMGPQQTLDSSEACNAADKAPLSSSEQV